MRTIIGNIVRSRLAGAILLGSGVAMAGLVALVVTLIVATSPSEAASCPRGQLTCGALCDLAAPNPHACKFASRDSCMSRFGNIRHCVARNADNTGRMEGRCGSGRLTCGAWCDRYSEDPRACKYTWRKSCVRLYGGVAHCIGNHPPRE